MELSSSSETGNLIQEGEVIFNENPKEGLQEVSKLTDSVISKSQGDQGKVFLRKKYSISRKMDSL